MSVIETPTLWDSQTVVTQPHKSTEEAFAAFCRRHTWFIHQLAAMAYEERDGGSTRGSMKLQFEQLRRQLPEVRTNNNWTPLASRRVMELYPDLDGYYKVKGRRS